MSDVKAEVCAVVVVEGEGSEVPVAGEPLHGPHVAPGDFQGLDDRRMPQPVGARCPQASLLAEGRNHPVYAAPGQALA